MFDDLVMASGAYISVRHFGTGLSEQPTYQCVALQADVTATLSRALIQSPARSNASSDVRPPRRVNFGAVVDLLPFPQPQSFGGELLAYRFRPYSLVLP